MGRIISIPLVGWIIGPVLATFWAIPFYVLWHGFRIREMFPMLPEYLLNIGFWNMVGLFLTVSVLKCLLIGGIVTVTVNNKAD